MGVDARELRNALGRFATGVCVVTANDADAKPFGMTVNSFASLSLDPPLVIWSIAKSSDCFARFEAIEHYAVNVLKADQQPVSDRYARKGEHELIDGDWKEGVSACPVLSSSLAVFECAVEQRVEGGDHVILVGRVNAFAYEAAEKPLLFFGGAYGALD